jgi:hypothetical protein
MIGLVPLIEQLGSNIYEWSPILVLQLSLRVGNELEHFYDPASKLRGLFHPVPSSPVRLHAALFPAYHADGGSSS